MDIKELRKEMGLTQLEFAAKIGVNYITVSRWERGVAKPVNMLVIARLEKFQKMYFKGIEK